MMSRDEWTKQQNSIRRFRRQRNLRLRDVAKMLGLNQPGHVADWEKGRRSPSLENALKLSAVLSCPVEVLYSDHFRIIRHNIHLLMNEQLNNNKNENEPVHPRGRDSAAA
jgi:transcriptional regulator with XRE-family HTH domain